MRLKDSIFKINKLVRRSYVDLEYCLNDIILGNGGSEFGINFENSKESVMNTLKNIE